MLNSSHDVHRTHLSGKRGAIWFLHPRGGLPVSYIGIGIVVGAAEAEVELVAVVVIGVVGEVSGQWE